MKSLITEDDGAIQQWRQRASATASCSGARRSGAREHGGQLLPGKAGERQIEYLTKEEGEAATKAFTAAQASLSVAVKEFNAKMAERK